MQAQNVGKTPQLEVTSPSGTTLPTIQASEDKRTIHPHDHLAQAGASTASGTASVFHQLKDMPVEPHHEFRPAQLKLSIRTSSSRNTSREPRSTEAGARALSRPRSNLASEMGSAPMSMSEEDRSGSPGPVAAQRAFRADTRSMATLGSTAMSISEEGGDADMPDAPGAHGHVVESEGGDSHRTFRQSDVAQTVAGAGWHLKANPGGGTNALSQYPAALPPNIAAYFKTMSQAASYGLQSEAAQPRSALQAGHDGRLFEGLSQVPQRPGLSHLPPNNARGPMNLSTIPAAASWYVDNRPGPAAVEPSNEAERDTFLRHIDIQLDQGLLLPEDHATRSRCINTWYDWVSDKPMTISRTDQKTFEAAVNNMRLEILGIRGQISAGSEIFLTA